MKPSTVQCVCFVFFFYYPSLCMFNIHMALPLTTLMYTFLSNVCNNLC